MEYVQLGKSGLTSSVIGLGGGSSSRFGMVKGGSKSDALRLIGTALDEGIAFFDGAGICGGVDELLAEGLGDRRKDVLLSTKVHVGPEPILFSVTRLAHRASFWASRRFALVCNSATLRNRVERTLKALRTDRIDVLHLHAVTPRQYPTAMIRVVPELLKMKREGKLRAIGITEGFLTDPNHAMLRAALGDACLDTIMVGLNPGNAGAAEFVLPEARRAGIGVIGMFALRGVLTSPITRELEQIREEAGLNSLSELAYRFSRHQAGMDVVLTGTSNPGHLRQNVAAVLSPALSAAVLNRLQKLGG
jgi:aryl-alcohol dehydrogenase-like predicted oxidoreductase